jgi:ATP-dependent exoDNAse (exonuclease V) alpha subunit
MRIVGLRRDQALQSSKAKSLPILGSPLQRNLALALPSEDFPVVMITGRAGTGKSTLVREIAKSAENQVVLSYTGAAALNAGGQTINSFFRLPLHIIDPAKIQPDDGRRHVYENLERIIIDEMSMVRADMLDAIDHSLRVNRGKNIPFGGVKVIMIGDFLQLPPIVANEETTVLRDRGYQNPYIVAAAALQELHVKFVEMTRVYRQSDPEFIRLLGDIRIGRNVENAVNAINEMSYRPHQRAPVPIILTPTNEKADRYNRDKLAELPGRTFTYTGVLQGTFEKEDKLPVPLRLDLKVGARVVMVKNDPGRNWVNGSLGTVIRTEPDYVWVHLDGNGEHQIHSGRWEKIAYRWSQIENRIVPEVVGSYSQLPLKAAWALTIHKAQGLTLEDVRVDFGMMAFAPGQAYVALSRAKSPGGLSLARPLTVADVKVDPTLLAVTEEIAKRSTPWTGI